MKKRTIIAGLLFSLLLTGCNADTPHQSAAPLTSEVQPTNDVTGADYDETFGKAQAAFTLSLLQKNAEAYQGENLLLSPYSVMQALAMTANGASGETLSEMEQTLGGIPCAKLNEYLYTQRTGMPDSENAKFKVILIEHILLTLTVSQIHLYYKILLTLKLLKDSVIDMVL